MIMQSVMNATDVRKNWGQFNDDVIRKGPQFVKRNRDEWAALSSEHLKAAFTNFRFHPTFHTEDDGTCTITIDEIDLVENGDTKEKALELMTEEIIEYANEYQENFNQYYHSPNRLPHFPYVLNVLAQEKKSDVRSLIECPVGEK